MSLSERPFHQKFLIAMPMLEDPFFSETVVCMCEHDGEGAFGIIVNRPLQRLFQGDIFRELGLPTDKVAESAPVFHGGPVREQGIFILHGPPFSWTGCVPITKGLGLSCAMDILQAISEGSGPQDYLMMLGCAGWGAGQLEAEMRENVWLTHAIDPAVMFSCAPEKRWALVLRQLGIRPDMLSPEGGRA